MNDVAAPATTAAPATNTGTTETTTQTGFGSTFKESNNAPSTETTTTAPDRSWLPQEYQNDPTFKDVGDVATLAKNYHNTQKLVGQKVLAKPPAGAPPEQVALYRKTIGVPDTVDGYKLPVIELPADVGLSQDEFNGTIKKYYEKMLELGAPPEVAEGIGQFYAEDLAASLAEAKAGAETAATQKADQDDAAFADMIGKRFGDKAPAAHAIAQSLLSKFVPADMAEVVKGLSNDQLMMFTVALDGIANEYIAEDKRPTTQNPTMQSGFTDADRIKLMTERANLIAQDQYGNREAIAKLNERIAVAYGRKK